MAAGYEFIGLANVTQEVVEEGMSVLQDFQRGPLSYLDEGISSADRPVVAARAVEEKMRDVLRNKYPGLSVFGEIEGQDPDDEDFNQTVLLGPLDGIRALAAGASSSVVVASLMSGYAGEVTTSTIGEASTGRVWQAYGHEIVRKVIIDVGGGNRQVTSAHPTVWEGGPDDDATVFVDNLKPFVNHNKVIFDAEGINTLVRGLQPRVSIHNYGSTVLHNALVANGGDRVAGAITTSSLGPWDFGGALHVRNAGGVVEAYTVTRERKLIPKNNPLDPFDVDIMITANSQETMEFLREQVQAAFAG